VVVGSSAPAKVISGKDADIGAADMKPSVARAENYFTLWYKTKLADGRWESDWHYVSILGQNGEEANARALEAANRIASGDLTGILSNVRGDYETAYAKLQNAFNLDTVNNLARATRSGTVFQQITDQGTIAKVPVFRNAIFAASGKTHLGAMPNIQELSAKVLQETTDAENVNVAKGFIQSALGYPVPQNAFDSILEKSMIEQALEQAENGRKTYIMPVTVPYYKRAQMMESVAKNTGLKVVVGKITQNDKFTVCEWC